jgi:L-iditol 2-dehydrogenase
VLIFWSDLVTRVIIGLAICLNLEDHMKALMKMKIGLGNVELVDIPEPKEGPGEVKIEVKAAGVCGTDMHIKNGHFKSYPPVVLGHEISGQIIAIGDGVRSVQPGDRVTINPGAGRTCGHCQYCLTGYYMFCSKREGIGSKLNGGFAKYITVREEIIYRLPKEVSYETGTLSEPFACAIQAVLEQTQIKPADLVYISGPGLMGLLAMQLVLIMGGKVVIGGLPKDNERLLLAKDLGAVTTVVIGQDNISDIISDYSHGVGANVAIECSGSESSLNMCLNILAPQGQLTQIGIMKGPITLDYNQIFYKQLKLQGSFAANWRSWSKAMDLLCDSKIQLKPLISDHLPLSKWEIAFANLENRVGIRTILVPDG